MVEKTVPDTGEGIPPEYLTGVYVPLHTAYSHKTGMGLSISRLIADKHLGSIRIESEKGVGTSVEVLLPSFE